MGINGVSEQGFATVELVTLAGIFLLFLSPFQASERGAITQGLHNLAAAR